MKAVVAVFGLPGSSGRAVRRAFVTIVQAPYQAPYQNTSPGLLARFRAEGALCRWWGAPRH